MILLATLLLAAQTPDAAHRADAARTRALNRDAARHNRAPAASAHDRAAYDAARADYAAELARWRRRVADCRAGDHAACGPR